MAIVVTAIFAAVIVADVHEVLPFFPLLLSFSRPVEHDVELKLKQ